MKIILKKEVKGLGAAGEVVKVSAGYARNYLVPRGMAVEATPHNLKKLESLKKQELRQQEQEKREAREAEEKLEGALIQLEAKAGEKGRLFGSITAQEIAQAVKKQKGLEIDKRKLMPAEPLKELGQHNLSIKLHPEVQANFTVEVIPKGDK